VSERASECVCVCVYECMYVCHGGSPTQQLERSRSSFFFAVLVLWSVQNLLSSRLLYENIKIKM
jgi:hypothetical protein